MEKRSANSIATLGDLDRLKSEMISELRFLLDSKKESQPKRWVKTTEARKILGFSAGKLQAVRENGLLPYTKIGGNLYYDTEDLAKLFTTRKVHEEKE